MSKEKSKFIKYFLIVLLLCFSGCDKRKYFDRLEFQKNNETVVVMLPKELRITRIDIIDKPDSETFKNFTDPVNKNSVELKFDNGFKFLANKEYAIRIEAMSADYFGAFKIIDNVDNSIDQPADFSKGSIDIIKTKW